MTRNLLAAILLGAAGAIAQPSPTPATAPAPTSSEPRTESGEENGETQTAPSPGKENERFDPSEKITEDLSVSFPSDI